LAVIPGINPPVINGFLRLGRVQAGADASELVRLRGVVAFYSVILATSVVVAVVGRPPTVHVTNQEAGNAAFAQHLAAERRFLTGDEGARPKVCVALSGGGIRSAAFSLGVLQSLHATGALKEVQVISAVSGGTYALSWLLLQPYYADVPGVQGDSIDTALSSMFDDAQPFQRNLREQSSFVELKVASFRAAYDATLGQIFRSLLQGNTYTRKGYAAQIQLAFHNHPRRGSGDALESANRLTLPKHLESLADSLWVVRSVEFSNGGRGAIDTQVAAVTGITAEANGLLEFLDATRSGGATRLPYPIFNVKLNVSDDAAHADMLWPAHFEITPLGMGGPAVGYAGWEKMSGREYRAIRSVNIAPAVSGAALSGYAQAVPRWARGVLRFLNADLGYHVPNPFSAGPRKVYLSDGGHLENLGLYALIRRECAQIVAVDAEYEPGATGADAKYKFEAYAKLTRAIAAEGVARLTLRDDFRVDAFRPAEPFFQGMLEYMPSKRSGSLLYIKLALDRAKMDGLPPEVLRYATAVHAQFPHDSTLNQSYAPDQFQAYQKLGYHVACRALAETALGTTHCY
jgi:hypothetical protein